MPGSPDRLPFTVLAAIVCLLCCGCATEPTAPDGSKLERSPEDPWESMNRVFYRGTTNLDRYTFKPLAKGYEVVIPGFLRTGIGNFSENLRGPLNIINNFLQGKVGEGFRQTGRFILNSTFGIAGLMDPATVADLPVQPEDFGQTLAVWGVPDGPFVFVPFIGPRTLRDAAMIPLNIWADPLFHYDNSSVRSKVYFVRLIDLRARYLKVEPFVGDAYDPYIRVREAYLQRRRDQIYDGNPPEESYDDFPDQE